MMSTERETQYQTTIAQLEAEAIALAEALHTVMSESDDPESVRTAVSALTGTETGSRYLTANPLGR